MEYSSNWKRQQLPRIRIVRTWLNPSILSNSQFRIRFCWNMFYVKYHDYNFLSTIINIFYYFLLNIINILLFLSNIVTILLYLTGMILARRIVMTLCAAESKPPSASLASKPCTVQSTVYTTALYNSHMYSKYDINTSTQSSLSLTTYVCRNVEY